MPIIQNVDSFSIIHYPRKNGKAFFLAFRELQGPLQNARCTSLLFRVLNARFVKLVQNSFRPFSRPQRVQFKFYFPICQELFLILRNHVINSINSLFNYVIT